MNLLEDLKVDFLNPPSEFSPIPFWFWNDELTKEELIRQIHEFHAKEVDGFVIHPRMGLPRSMPYLSEEYMNLVEIAVEEADALGMKVILYDEGMYPSGSANGKVVESNPQFASRGLELREHVCGEVSEPVRIPLTLSEGEQLVSAQAVFKTAKDEVDLSQTMILNAELNNDYIEFQPPHHAAQHGSWSIMLFVDTYSKGTIRGVHAGQDDGEPEAPLAADLLNMDATHTFIAFTHEKYYERLSRYFGTTIFAMFTDEPDLLGRGHKRGLKPWTTGFIEVYIAGGGREEELAALWFQVGEVTDQLRQRYKSLIRNRLARTYYKPLSDWCADHGIGLTGHPADSDDIGLLEHFHIPGQDVVWRFIAPEDHKSLIGPHSTMGKCSSDAARHRGRRRNLNESFGVCGIEGGWSLTADNMKWYLDWLFVRGVNLIVPHAFYYSIRDDRRDERPPDVGMNNIWWSEYAQFAKYIKRMSWLMTDSKNGAKVAVLTGEAELPWKMVKPLYEEQIEFNYLEESLLHEAAQCLNGSIQIAGYSYQVVIIEKGSQLSRATRMLLHDFIAEGGLVIEMKESGEPEHSYGQLLAQDEQEVSNKLKQLLGQAYKLMPASQHIRISQITKNGVQLYVVVNEGEADYNGTLLIEDRGQTEIWRPWEGSCEQGAVATPPEGQHVALSVNRREAVIVAVVPEAMDSTTGVSANLSLAVSNNDSIRSMQLIEDLSSDWQVLDGPSERALPSLTSWTEWAELEHFSGSMTYEKKVKLAEPSQWSRIELDLGEVHELVHLWVNEQYIGVRMWKPYTFDIGEQLQDGMNVVRVKVTNSLANKYDRKSFPSGLLGPVSMISFV